MNQAERKAIRRIRAMVKTGDREGAYTSLGVLLTEPRPRAVFSVIQLALHFAAEMEPVPCRMDKMGGTIPLRTCLVLRSRVWPSGNRKGSPVHLQCVGCELGAEHAKRLPQFVPPPQSQAPEVLPQDQRRARDRAAPERALSWAEHPMTIASGMTPDDPNDWRA